MLKIETGDDWMDAVLPTDKPLLAILEEWQCLSMQSKLSNLSVERNNTASLKATVSENDTFPNTLMRTYEGIHHSNIISVLSCELPCSIINPEAQGTFCALVTGSADKSLRITDADSGNVLTILSHQESSILTIDQHPIYSHIILTGGMNGSHHLLDLAMGQSIQSWKDHQKYIVRAQFSPDGLWFATASYDKSINVYQKDQSRFTLQFTMTFRGPAESICFVKSVYEYNQDIHLVVGVREDNYLHYICLNKESGFPYKTFNMNENGDDWVSFTAMELSVSPSGNHILCYTDSTSGRLIVFKSHSSEQVMNLYGTQIDSFSQPRACWHSNGHYVFATSDDHKIYVFDVVTGRVMNKLIGHEGVVRDLSFNSGKNILVSCGFDKTVRMWTT